MNRKTMLGALSAIAALLIGQAALADENSVKKAVSPVLEQLFGPGVKADAVRKAGALNLYEIQIAGELLYTDETVSYLIQGDILDVKARRNLTEERKNKLSQIKFSDLPLELAIKQVKGNGKRVIATFEDPNCTYCKKLAKEFQNVTDVTIYTFIYPIFPNSGELSRNIWCASDRAKAWNDYLINGTQPAVGKCDTSGIDKTLAAGKNLNIRGTPALFFADGSRVPGYMPAQMLEKVLDKGSANLK